MPGLLDIGNKPYEAARGDYSPGTLLNARGDIITRDANGPVRLGKGVAAQVVGWDANDAKALYVPGHLLFEQVADVTTPNTTSETSMISGGPVAAVYPALVGAGDAAHVRASGHLAVAGTASTFRTRLYWGATAIMDFTNSSTSGTASRNWVLDLMIVMASAGKVRMSGYFMAKAAAGTGWQALGAVGDLAFPDGLDVAVTTSSAQAFDLTSTASSGTATTNTCSLCQVRYYPKNY